MNLWKGLTFWERLLSVIKFITFHHLCQRLCRPSREHWASILLSKFVKSGSPVNSFLLNFIWVSETHIKKSIAHLNLSSRDCSWSGQFLCSGFWKMPTSIVYRAGARNQSHTWHQVYVVKTPLYYINLVSHVGFISHLRLN